MQTFLEIGLANAFMASALALLAAGVGFCCRPALRHTLWLLVLLKLVTPPLLSIPVSCPPALEAVLAQRPTADYRPSALGPAQIDPQQAAVSDLASQEEDWSVEIPPAALTAELSLSPSASDPEAPGFHSPLASGWT